MQNLGPLFFLLLVQTAPPIQCQSHVTVDDIGKAYQVNGPEDVQAIGNKLETWQHAEPLAELGDGSTYIAVAATNLGTWSIRNPGGILLSTDPGVTPSYVTDSTWKCKGYPDDGTGRMWPVGDDRIQNIKDFVLSFPTERNAVQLSPNWNFNWGTIERIDLGANWIWYAGLGQGDADNLPPNNVICMKELP